LGVDEIPAGYRVILRNPKVELHLARDYRVTEAITDVPGQRIDEHLSFTSSPLGYLFTGVEAVNQEGSDKTDVRYEVEYQEVDKFMLPRKVHVVVNDSINMKFALEKCSVEKGTMIQVAPPPPR
jgi:aspartyl-tRNA synthetase